MDRIAVSALLCVCLLAPTTGVGQEAEGSAVATGEEVRLRVDGRAKVYRFVSLSPDSLVVRADGRYAAASRRPGLWNTSGPGDRIIPVASISGRLRNRSGRPRVPLQNTVHQGLGMSIVAIALGLGMGLQAAGGLSAPVPTGLSGPVPAALPGPATPTVVALAPERAGQVRVTTRIVVVDRDQATRAGVGYAVVGHDRVRLADGGRVLGARAFLELARERRLLRSESTQQVLVISGGTARVGSTQLAVGAHGTRTRGPTMEVVPTLSGDGAVHLWIDARLEDSVTWGWWGHRLDGSPAAVVTELLTRPGDEVIVASGRVTEASREGGLFRRGSASHEREVLIVVGVELVE